jgi:hypothetical protein
VAVRRHQRGLPWLTLARASGTRQPIIQPRGGGRTVPEATFAIPDGLPVVADRLAPNDANPRAIRAWFDALMDEEIPEADGTLDTARRAAAALARRAKAENTRRAYRAGVRAWCAWCARHDLPALPAAPADIAAFLAEQRYPPPPAKPLAVNTVKLRKAAIRYLHYLAGLPSPPPPPWSPRFAGLDRTAREAGDRPRSKLAAKIALLPEIVARWARHRRRRSGRRPRRADAPDPPQVHRGRPRLSPTRRSVAEQCDGGGVPDGAAGGERQARLIPAVFTAAHPNGRLERRRVRPEQRNLCSKSMSRLYFAA